MKILIVEDEATLASLLEEELVQWGYLSKKASNFNDILAEVTDFKPDLVLMLSLIHISEPTRRLRGSRMPSSA